MTDQDFLAAVNELLADDDLTPAAINKITVALALDARRTAQTTASATQQLEEMAREARAMAAEAVAANQEANAQLRSMIQTQHQSIQVLKETVAANSDYIKEHPTLIYLLRYRTRQTIAVLLAFFLLLLATTSPEIRAAVLAWLGFPGF
jgi:thioesterase domain-containing protein